MVPFEEPPQRILDVGTGTGIWAMDIADYYPSAEVIGTDLSPIQPRWVPPNCRFEIDDAEAEWNWTSPFDFIHSRTLAFSISDWPRYIAQIYKHTKPGGWVQLVEHELNPSCDDDTYGESTASWKYAQILLSSLEQVGKNTKVAENLKKYVEDAGFINIKETALKLPCSAWPKDPQMKELGKWCVILGETGLEAYALACMSRAPDKKTKDEIRELVDSVKEDQRTRRVHIYQYHRYVIGQKPLDTPTK